MRRALAFLASGMFAVALLLSSSPFGASPTAAVTIAPTTKCSNGVDNTAGLGLICQIKVVNTITPTGGWAKVTARECHGAAGDPTASCSTVVSVLTAPVKAVTQCNDSINGGGGTLRCSVRVANKFFGMGAGASAATVNQCVGSGGGKHTGCDPFPATTSGATITQCNGSANGGTLVGLTCTATGKTSSAQGVKVNQCNGSANGGGSLVICSTNISNQVMTTPAPAPPTKPSTTTTTSGGPTLLSNTSMNQSSATPTASIGAIAVVLIAIVGLLLVALRRPQVR
jgi:hypothetical protein